MAWRLRYSVVAGTGAMAVSSGFRLSGSSPGLVGVPRLSPSDYRAPDPMPAARRRLGHLQSWQRSGTLSDRASTSPRPAMAPGLGLSA